MKFMNCLRLAGLIVLASGCAFNRQVVLENAVGPAPRVLPSLAPEGSLAVYSAWDTGSTEGPEGVLCHSGYKIYSLEGKALKYVDNRVHTFSGDPATVSLPPGKYKVVARAATFGMVTVAVVIEAGKTTFVHLDGSELASGQQGSASELVRLPDGLIIGWRAKENVNPQ